ncbi:MAG: Fic family protein [Sarcina sp.]
MKFCKTEKSRGEIQEFLKLKDRNYLMKSILKPLIEKEYLALTIPEKPKSKNQKYKTINKNY